MPGRTLTPRPGRPGHHLLRLSPRHRQPRHAAACPETVRIREDHLLGVIRQFFAQRIFGPDRAAILAATLPADDTDAASRQQQQAEAQLTDLATPAPRPDLLDVLPLLGDILTRAPARRQQQLYQAFDLQILYDSGKHQVSIHAVISSATPRTLAAIISDSEPPAHPDNGDVAHLVQVPRTTADHYLMLLPGVHAGRSRGFGPRQWGGGLRYAGRTAWTWVVIATSRS